MTIEKEEFIQELEKLKHKRVFNLIFTVDGFIRINSPVYPEDMKVHLDQDLIILSSGCEILNTSLYDTKYFKEIRSNTEVFTIKSIGIKGVEFQIEFIKRR